MFKAIGVLVLLYCASAISQGEVYVKSGLGGRSVSRAESPEYFWVCVSIYIALALALLLVF